MEIFSVPFCFEQVDLREELLFFLFELRYLFFKVGRIHGLRPQTFNSLVNGLEFSLQVFEDLHGVAHFLVNHELVRHLKRNQETGCVRFSLQVGQSGKHPVKNVLQSFLFAVHNLAAEIRVEVCWVA